MVKLPLVSVLTRWCHNSTNKMPIPLKVSILTQWLLKLLNHC